MDYELEDALALQKLKEAQALRGAKLPDAGGIVGSRFVPNLMGMVKYNEDRAAGNRMEDEAIARQRELSGLQDAEVKKLQTELITPGRALRQGEGPLLDPTRDMSPTEENQRQMDIGMRMMSLPKARAIGTQFVNSGVGFPEKQAQLESSQALLREQQAARLQGARELAQQRIEAQSARDADNRALRLTLAGMSASNRNGNADLDRQIKEARLNALEAKARATPALPVGAQKVQASLQNLESGVGAYEELLKGYNPQSKDALTDTKRAAIGSAFTDLQMRLKEAYELGAITGPDMQVLQSAITDPTSAWGMARGAAGGTKPFEAQISQTKAALQRQKANFEQQYGVTLPEARGSVRAPMPGTTPLSGGPASGYEDSAKEARYQKWLLEQQK